MDNTSSFSNGNGCEDERIEIYSHHGVILKSSVHHDEDTSCSGTLTINQYYYGKGVEWKPIAISEVSECPEQEEWAMVNTIGRTRTTSGGYCESPRLHPVNIALKDIKSYLISKRKREVTIYTGDGGSASFVFQYGNIKDFVHALRTFLITRRSRRKRALIISEGERNESQPLTHSFAELNLFSDNPTDAVWRFVSNLKRRPYETTLETFSKLTDTILYRAPEQRPPEEMAAELVSSLHELPEGTLEVEGYQVVGDVPTTLSERRKDLKRGPELSMELWKEAMDEEGRVKDPHRIKKIIFRGGLSKPVRFIVWKFLLGYFPWNSTNAERQEITKKRADDYFKMKLQWRTMTLQQEENFSRYRDHKSLIEKDVNRTDRTMPFFAGDDNPNLRLLNDILMTYVMYNFDLGYVQGMSDLLAPILMIMMNEVDAFWCFVGFMDRVCSNFDLDQAGMKNQLSALFGLISTAEPKLASYLERHDSSNMFFCFRWLLVLFKREFCHEDIIKLWEVLWTDLPCPNFHLLISTAILDTEKDLLMEMNYGFTEILKHVNDLSMKIELNPTLITAEAIYWQLIDNIPNLTQPIKKLIGLIPEDSSNDSQDESSLSEEPDDSHDNEISIIHNYSDEDAYEKGLSHNFA